MHHFGRSKKLLKTWKRTRAGEARNSLKLDSTSPSLNREPYFFLTLPYERQKKNENPTLKGYGSIVADWRVKP
jgi:hypothetical protein